MTCLVATDLSPRSDRAVHRAALLARQGQMPLTVLHILDDDLPEDILEQQRASADRCIRSQLDQAQAHDAAVEIVEGRPHQAILTRAKALEARLIVLGSHRDRGLLNAFFGTTAERVIRAGRLPVLMVSEVPAGPYARAVTGVDFSDHGIHAARLALDLFPDCGQRLVHAYDVPFAGFRTGDAADKETREEHARRLAEMVAANLQPAAAGTTPLEQVVRRGAPLEMLLAEARKADADLIIVGTRGQGGAARHLLGSVAHDLLADPPCDVLVAHA